MSIRAHLVPVLAIALTFAPGCKKDGESAPPDDASETGDAGQDAGDREEDGDAAADELLTQNVFEEQVQDHMDDVGECYGQASAENPELAGKVIVNFTIAVDGSVEESSIDEGSTLNDEAMNTCLQGKIAGWRFAKPASGEPMKLTFPFNLAPG